MSAPASGSVTLLRSWEPRHEVRPRPTGCYTCPVRVLSFRPGPLAITGVHCPAILSPGDPYSVVFPINTTDDSVAILDEVPHELPLSWHGIPCRLVQARIGLPVVGSPVPRPFRMLALFPTEPVEDVPPHLRLGAEFLAATGAAVRLFTRPTHGELIIPYA